jgi:hypothetical protein
VEAFGYSQPDQPYIPRSVKQESRVRNLTYWTHCEPSKETMDGNASSTYRLVSLATSCDTPRPSRLSSAILTSVHRVAVSLQVSRMTAFGKRTDIRRACYSFYGLARCPFERFTVALGGSLQGHIRPLLEKTTVVSKAMPITSIKLSDSLIRK